MTYQGVSSFRDELNIIRWSGAIYALGVSICSIAALILHDTSPKAPWTRFAYRLTGIFGKGEIVYTVPALVSILGSYQNDLSATGWLLFTWMLFMIGRPIERVSVAIHQFRTESAGKLPNESIGIIDRIDDPNIVRVRLTKPSEWKTGTLFVAMMPGGKVNYVLALFNQVQRSEVIGTGLCLAVAQDDVQYRDVKIAIGNKSTTVIARVTKIAKISKITLVLGVPPSTSTRYLHEDCSSNSEDAALSGLKSSHSSASSVVLMILPYRLYGAED